MSLALLLGGLAASDVAGREAALRRELGPAVPVVVARVRMQQGARLLPTRLAVRSVPARYAPAGSFASVAEVAGLRAAVAIPAGADVARGVVDDGNAERQGPALGAGERVADIVAVGSAALIVPGDRVDVLVTRETASGTGTTRLALRDVEVLAARPAHDAAADPAPRVAVSLRVTLREAVYLAAAQSFARELRVLVRGRARAG